MGDAPAAVRFVKSVRFVNGIGFWGTQWLQRLFRALNSQESTNTLLNVNETASLLGVSETWVRRHIQKLPSVRVGRLVRFDSTLLRRQFQGRTDTRNCLETGKVVAVNFRRWQCGSVVKQGKKDRQVWFGVWREDIRDGDGRTTRRQRKVRVGTVAELPNRTMARERLSVLMQQNSKSTTKLTFVELFERWKQAVVPTLKDSTA